MAGRPAHILPGQSPPIGPSFASKTQMKIFCSLPTFTSSIRPQNPRQNRLFAPKTQQSVWVRPLQTKIMCKTPPPNDPIMLAVKAFFAFGPTKWVVEGFVEYYASTEKIRYTFKEVGYLFGRLFTDFKRIKEELGALQRLLGNAESALNTVEGSEDIRDEVFFKIRDVIDDFDTFNETTQRARFEVGGCVQRFFSRQPMTRRVQRFSSLQLMTRCVRTVCMSLPLRTRFWVNFQIFSINLKIRDSSPGEYYGILREEMERKQKASSPFESLPDRRRSSAETEEPEVVVGLQEEIKTVREQLTNGEESRGVISIVGMGGSGKTTLAKRVFHDVKDAFECHAFICLSQRYEIKDVMMRMIEDVIGLSREQIKKLNEEDLRGKLRNHLKKKKYLVVIDDIWSKEAWDMLQFVLPDVNNQSRVMLTTRNRNVALRADPSSPVEMPFLVGDAGWELFMKKIFPKEKNPATACPSELEDIGKKILAKCGGLPLVILAMGSLLAGRDKTRNAWSGVLDIVYPRVTEEPVLDGVHVHPTDDPKWCMKILALSYWDLPYDLKPCFLYFGLFPEDYEIDTAKLIRLWIAEGFILRRKHTNIEDDAEEYLEKLIQRSMIQVSWKQHDGSVGGCRIHDLFREFAILRAQKNNFFTIHNVEGTRSLPNNIRRLALHCSIDGYHAPETLRSILDFCDTIDISGAEFRQAEFLRVLSQDFVHGRKAAILIEELKEFVHLRYLELVESSESLPSSSLGDLDNLQTLVLMRCYGSLPDAISNLKQLRHLFAPCCKVRNLRVKDLTNLRTLSLASGNWIKDGFGNLTYLRELSIWQPPSLNEEALSDSIEKLRSLRSLTLDGSFRLPQLMPFTNHVHLYEMLLAGRMKKLPELPPHLTELTLCGSWLEQDDISKLEKLPRLKILHLICCSYKSEEMIFSSAGFPHLEILEMSHMALKEWTIEEGAMPSLKSVVLSLVRDLKTETLPERVRVLLNSTSSSRKKRSGA